MSTFTSKLFYCYFILKIKVALSMRYVRLIILLICCATFSCTYAQQRLEYFFKQINQADGLLHNEVRSITQDKKGYIWIASNNGLQRYDGASFVNYPQMQSNPAVAMYADKANNTLWISDNINLEKMDLGKNIFRLYNKENLLNHPLFTFDTCLDSNNEKWLLGDNAVYKYNRGTKKYELFQLNIIPTTNHQSSFIVKDSTRNYSFVSTPATLLFFDKKNKRVYEDSFNISKFLSIQSVLKEKKLVLRYVMLDSKKNIWVTTWGDVLIKINDETKKINTYSLSALKSKQEGKKVSAAGLLINCIMEDNNHTIWIGTENAGLLKYNNEKDNFDYCIAQQNNSRGLQYTYKIFNLFQDRENNIWVATDRGISIFNPYQQYFSFIRHQEDNPLSISKGEITGALQTANEDIYIGTWGSGISIYDKAFHFKKNIIFKGAYENNFVWSFVQFTDHILWIGCQRGYLLQYNIYTEKVQAMLPPEMEGSTIRCMEKDNNGNILFGLQNGKIVKWDNKQKKFFPCMSDIPENAKTSSFVHNIFIDKAQHCWVATNEGFKEFDIEKRIFTNTWLPNKNNTNSISTKICKGIEELNDSILLVGTTYGGLNFFNKKTKIFSHETTVDGLPSNSIYALKKDDAGFVWFTTDYGLYKFKPTDKKIIPYKIENGQINAAFESKKFYPLKDGQWLSFTTSEAIAFFPYHSNNTTNTTQKIEITSFKIFEKPLFLDSILFQKKPVQLSYKDNFFTISFASLNFGNLQQTNYYYRLTGVDKDWVNAGTRRFANYTDVQPGEFLFEVKADDANSMNEITSFTITITPPFWKTWWFISLILLSIFLLLYLFIKWRIKSIKTIAAEKLKVQHLNAEQYKNKLELEQIINYFSTSLIEKKAVDDVLWDVAKNLIAKLGFVDCMIYLWNEDKTKMIQKASIGPKDSLEEINKQYFDVLPGQGLVGFVMQHKEPVVVADTSKDNRYRQDEMARLSEITVPIIYNNELLGVIDSEHPEKNFYTQQHLQLLTTIATLVADKIKSIEAEQLLQHTNIEMYRINEQLSKTKLEALRSQMNPHFIFNSLNAIDNLIQTNQKEKATTYLARFAKLIRNVLDSSKNDVVAFQKDYETLELYLQMEQFRCSNKFTYELLAEDELMYGDYKVLPLIVQPFVENAIHHGLLNKQIGDKKLMVNAILENDYIIYNITDNGVGREKAQQLKEINKPEHQSYGIDITKERIQLYNQNKETDNVIITDMFEKNEPSGTKVEIKIKIF
jgi:ligand-binding sensor domain-containing protein/putative methionine-R-sulfoxide reductase with GAF domain/anti-sigma regulatory factor (Ser/Thr protein kinase)